ncbi:MAG: Gfo/Idh/MocA family protein [Anaerolineae bacterium]
MNKYKIGLVGLHRGGGIVRAMSHHPQCEISALCDINPQVLAEMGASFGLADSRLFTSFDEFVNSDVDVIVIATPIEYHAAMAIQAMEAGKHVLSEQTAAYSAADCQKIIETTNRTGKTYMMAENYSYYHCVLEWKKLIQADRLGKIYHAEGEYIHEIVNLLVDPETGERKWRYPRAPIWYCGHSLGPLLFLMEDRVVKATGVTPGKNMHPDEEGISFLDMETGLFLTEKGSVIKILASQTVKRYRQGGAYLTWYCLYGTKGFVESGRDVTEEGLAWLEDEDTPKAGARRVSTPFSDPNAPPEALAGGHGTGEYYMVRDLIDCLDTGRRPFFDAVRAAEVTVPGLVAHQSAMAGGVWLDVPSFR